MTAPGRTYSDMRKVQVTQRDAVSPQCVMVTTPFRALYYMKMSV